MADAQLRPAADRETQQPACCAGARVALHQVALVEDVVQCLVDIVMIDEHDGAPFSHRHLHPVHLLHKL
eukprot:802788-Prymnesium_polylepis.1